MIYFGKRIQIQLKNINFNYAWYVNVAIDQESLSIKFKFSYHQLKLMVGFQTGVKLLDASFKSRKKYTAMTSSTSASIMTFIADACFYTIKAVTEVWWQENGKLFLITFFFTLDTKLLIFVFLYCSDFRQIFLTWFGTLLRHDLCTSLHDGKHCHRYFEDEPDMQCCFIHLHRITLKPFIELHYVSITSLSSLS